MSSSRLPSSRERFQEFRAEFQLTATAGPRRRRPQRSSLSLVKSFLTFLAGHQGPLAWALGTLTVATLLGLLPPAATKFVVDNVLTDAPLPAFVPDWVPREPFPLLVSITLGVIAITAVKIAIQVSGRWSATRVVKLVQVAVRKEVFEHAIRLPLHRAQEIKTGGAVSILRQDASSVGDLVFGLLYNPWRAIVQLIGSICILAWVDWRLLFGALILIPLVYFTHHTWISRIRPQHRRARTLRQEIDALATESFGGIRVVRAFNRHRSETNRILRSMNLLARQQLYTWWWSRIVELFWQALIPLASSALLMYGGWRVLSGALTLGDLMMFLVYLLLLLEPLAILAQSAAQFQDSLAGLDRVLDLLDEPREFEAAVALPLRRAEVRGRITFDNVCFSYPGADDFALSEICLEVQPGETIALVGPSGAGKTTLCNLAMRFYDPTSGRVLLDGRDLREIDIDSFRNLLGVVEQDVFLFDGTIADNIAYSNRQASPHEVQNAAEIANADGFVRELPNGYQTLIGERGVKLSGGQRQRIAIARAVLADPKILVLDEATSNLDTKSEQIIQASLTELMRHRTCLVIAHRLSTIVHASRIVMLKAGRVANVGSHEALLAHDDEYRSMVALQSDAITSPRMNDDL